MLETVYEHELLIEEEFFLLKLKIFITGQVFWI